MIDKMKCSFCALFLAGLIFCTVDINTPAYCDQDEQPYLTGLPELTQEDLEWQNKHMLRVKKVKINKLGLKRINEHRKKKGLDSITDSDVELADIGQDIEGVVGAVEEGTQSSEVPSVDLPSYIDNSTLKYFPPIRSQGSLPSCGVFSGTYYAMTYMYALANDIDAKNGGAACHLSPKWTYNMVNGGG